MSRPNSASASFRHRRANYLSTLISGGPTLPRTGLIWYAKAPGMVDTIGLSAAALWAALPTTHRSIYLVDETTLRSAEDIITNIVASEYLNDGGELVGSEAKGYAQYEDGTSESVLRKAYMYFGIGYTWIDLVPSLAVLPTSWDYGLVGAGSTSDKTFVLTNSGNTIAEDIEVSVSGTGFSVTSSAGPFNLDVDESANVVVRFAPGSAGDKTGTLTISWPNRDDITVSLYGEGEATEIAYDGVSSAGYVTLATETTVTIPKPDNVVEGDVLISVITANGRSAWLDGWTEILNADSIVFLRKVATSSEPATYTFSLTVSNNYAHGVILRFSGSVASYSGSRTENNDYNTTISYPAPTVNANAAVIWAACKANAGDGRTLSSITRGNIVYNQGAKNANTFPLWVAVETLVSAGSPITAASGVMSSANNNKKGFAICLNT